MRLLHPADALAVQDSVKGPLVVNVVVCLEPLAVYVWGVGTAVGIWVGFDVLGEAGLVDVLGVLAVQLLAPTSIPAPTAASTIPGRRRNVFMAPS